MIRRLVGLLGVLLAAVAAEFNDQVTSLALVDIRGALGIGHDPGTWIDSLYVSAEICGMALSPWFLVTLTLRRWTLFVITLNCVTTLLIPFSPNIDAIYVLRVVQGLAGGLTIPLLMATALHVLPPPIRLYGLAVYALTATFTPGFAVTMTSLSVDVVGWRLVFFETLPLCLLAGVLSWSCMEQDEPHYERFRSIDWFGMLTLALGFGALSTVLIQGDRLDWFNSDLICVLGLVSIVTIPAFLVNEWFHPLPLLKLQMLLRPNFAYSALALFLFLIIATSASTVPLQFLSEVQGYRPIQSQPITLTIVMLQFVMLPFLAWLLDHRHVDCRLVSAAGMALVLAACIGDSFVTIYWSRNQFYFWQVLQGIGQPMVVMPLLMMATNTVRGPDEAPFASAMINMPRALAEAVGPWLLDLVARWRGALHNGRIMDQIGRDRWRTIQAPRGLAGQMPPLSPGNGPPAPAALDAFSRAIEQQAAILTTSDIFLVLGAVTVALMVVLLVVPQRTLPPRILFAKV